MYTNISELNQPNDLINSDIETIESTFSLYNTRIGYTV